MNAKTPGQIKDTYLNLNQEDLEEIKSLIKLLENLQDLKVTNEGYQSIQYTIDTLEAFRKKYLKRIIEMYRKGYLLDNPLR